MSEMINSFAQLFRGRTDACGTEAGGCARLTVTLADYAAHLEGKRGLGIYPMVPYETEWFVYWGCVDLDVKADHKRRWDYETSADALNAACNLTAALRALGIKGWVEHSKSGGFHVWVFSRQGVEALVMRRALLVACGIAGVPPTEVNPKAEGFADPTTLGNYVRLPMFGALGHGAMERPIIDEQTMEVLDPAVAISSMLESASLAFPLDSAADLWRPEAPQRASERPAGTRVPSEAGSLSRRLTAVLEHGPLKAQDRSGWLFYVARLCADDGIDEEQALDLLTLADDLHTHKFTDRPDGQRQLERTIRRAYAS